LNRGKGDREVNKKQILNSKAAKARVEEWEVLDALGIGKLSFTNHRSGRGAKSDGDLPVGGL